MGLAENVKELYETGYDLGYEFMKDVGINKAPFKILKHIRNGLGLTTLYLIYSGITRDPDPDTFKVLDNFLRVSTPISSASLGIHFHAANKLQYIGQDKNSGKEINKKEVEVLRKVGSYSHKTAIASIITTVIALTPLALLVSPILYYTGKPISKAYSGLYEGMNDYLLDKSKKVERELS